MIELARIGAAVLLSCCLLYGNWRTVVPFADPYDTLILVNREHKAPVTAPTLVMPDIPPSKAEVKENLYLRPVAATALEQMFEAAEQEGHLLFGVSGYRSAGSQGVIYERRVSESGNAAKKMIAPGGYSEHQTGLVMDISGESTLKKGLVQSFGESPEGIWVAENAHRFGFIVRYQVGWEKVTGYSYEPWHLRYVGIEHAARMYELAIPLEEYLTLLQTEDLLPLLPTPEPTAVPEPTAAPEPTATPAPTEEPTVAPTPEPMASPEPTFSAKPTMTVGPAQEPATAPTASN